MTTGITCNTDSCFNGHLHKYTNGVATCVSEIYIEWIFSQAKKNISHILSNGTHVTY